MVALGVGLLFVPTVQKQIILRVLKGQVESFEVDKVAVSLRHVKLEDVRIFEAGSELNVEWVEVDVSLLDLVFGKPIVIKDMRMRGSGYFEQHQVESFVLSAKYIDGVVIVNQCVAEVYGGELQLMGRLNLPDEEENLIKLSGEIVLTEFSAELFDPGQGAPISGVWSGAGDFSSQARTFELLSEALVLKLELIGRNGELQFTRFSEKADSMGNMVSSGMSLLGMFSKNPKYNATAVLVASLKKIEFQELKLQLNRVETGRLNIGQLHIHGGDLMIQGSGFVDSRNWATLATAPLSLDLFFGTQGKLNESAQVLSLVGTQEMDYYSLWKNPVPIRGSMNNVNLEALTDLVGGALGF